MWISPSHPDPPKQSQAPNDDGVSLGTFARGDGRDELRVTAKSYEGHPYVSVRVWSRDDNGEYWPAKGKGVSIRLAEVAGVIEALRGATDKAVKELREQAGPERGGSAQPSGRPEPKRRNLWGPDPQRQEGLQKPPGAIGGNRRPESALGGRGRPRRGQRTVTATTSTSSATDGTASRIKGRA